MASLHGDPDLRPSGPECQHRCGWTAFPGRSTCCRSCQGAEGPHAKDCSIKNRPAIQSPALCAQRCGRAAFGSFATCCTRCRGPGGPHAGDCAQKGFVGAPHSAPLGALQGAPLGPCGELTDLEDGLRHQLEEWHEAGAMRSSEEVQKVIHQLVASSGVNEQAVKMLWLSVARKALPSDGPLAVYIGLAKRHHNFEAEVIDLGQYSAKHSNSCMFLTCAVALADRRERGHDDGPLGTVAEKIEAALPFGQAISLADLIQEHQQDRCSTLGLMADVLRDAACEVLLSEKDYFVPFFHPVSLVHGASSKDSYEMWVGRLRGDEEGDELVVLALSRLCGMAVQPVQKSGYRVPLMDPFGDPTGWISYWGNDDRHWVWLRPSK